MSQHCLLIALIVIVVCIPTGNMHAQYPALLWQHCYGGPFDELAYTVAVAPDGNLFASGITFGNGGDVSGYHAGLDGWAFRADAAGALLWQICLGTSGNELSSGILPLPDGGAIVGSLGINYPGGNYYCGTAFKFEDFWLLRLSPSGSIVWQQCYGGSGQDIPNALAPANDGGYFMAGFARSDDGDVTGLHGGKDAWVLKTDANGNLQWAAALGGSANDEAFDVVPTADGGCIVAASTSSTDGDVSGQNGSKDAWAVRLSASGEIVWQKAFGGSGNEESVAILELPDGGFLAAGFTNSNDGDVSGNHGEADAWVVRLDGDGSLLWQKCFGGSSQDYASSLIALPDGSFAVTGESASSDGDLTSYYGAYDCWLFGIDANGGLLWQKSFGGSDYDYPEDLRLMPNGELLLASSTKSNDHDVSGNHGAYDIWLARLSLGTTTTGVLEVPQKIQASIFPNPASNEFSLVYELPSASEVKVSLFDCIGRELNILSQNFHPKGIINENLTIPSRLPPGNYWLYIQSRFKTTALRVVLN